MPAIAPAPDWSASAIPAVSIGVATTSAIFWAAASTNVFRSSLSRANTSPGWVHSCPAEPVTDVTYADAVASARSASTPGSRNTGLTEDISA